jgi:O-antigen/teichoic acid export membrane protein
MAPIPRRRPIGAEATADARHAARSGAVQVLTGVAQGLLGASHAVLARLFGPAAYGLYLSALAVLELVSRAGVAGADKAMLRYVAARRAAGDPAGVRSALGTGLRLNLAVGGTLAVALALAAPGVAALLGRSALAVPLRILAPVVLFGGATLILVQATLAARVTRANLVVRGLAEPGLLLLAGAAAGLARGGITGLAAAHTAACLGTFALAVVASRRVFPPEERRRLWAAPSLAGFARFSLPMAAAEVLHALVQRGDLMMLAILRGPEAAAMYGAAEMVARPIVAVRSAFDSVVAGMLSEALHRGQTDRLRHNLRLVTRWVVSAAAPIAVTILVLRREILGLLFGAAYTGGAGVLLVLSLSQLASAGLGLVGWVLMVGGHSRLGLGNMLAAAAFNLTAAYLLTGWFGPVGTACATALTMLLLQGAMTVQAMVLHRVHPLSLGLLRPLTAALAAALMASAVRAEVQPWLRIPAVLIGGGISYAAALGALGLPEEERHLLRRALAWLGRERR